MPEAYASEAERYAPSANLYDEEDGESAEEEGYDEEEEAEDETAGGGFASLAGTRINRDPEGQAAGLDDEWGDESGYGGDTGSFQPSEPEGEDALELTNEAAESATPEPQGPQDELLLDADRLAEADQPVAGGRRRRLLGGGADEPERQSPPPKSGGSTLFERMANLSRSGSDASDEEEDEESEGSSSLRIPRFLGRQNNQ
jgi:cell division protein FtsZ